MTRGYRESGAEEEHLLQRIYGAGTPSGANYQERPGRDNFPPDPDQFYWDDNDDGDHPDRGQWVAWIGHPGCPHICQPNIMASPKKYGETFPSGDTEPPAHNHCNCELMIVSADYRPPPPPYNPYTDIIPLPPQNKPGQK